MEHHLEVWQMQCGRWGWSARVGPVYHAKGSAPSRAVAWSGAFAARAFFMGGPKVLSMLNFDCSTWNPPPR